MSARVPIARIAAVALFVWPTCRPAGGQTVAGEQAQRLVAARLAELEAMVRHQWWAAAESACTSLQATLKSGNVDNPIVLGRVDAARKAIDDVTARRDADPETRRMGELVKSVRSSVNRFPVNPTVLRVRPDGSGDARTLTEALARSGERDVIELGTGIFTVNSSDLAGKGRDSAGRSQVFFAARGEWPRLVPASGAAFTFERRVWLDGIEVLPGERGVGSAALNLRHCYLRAAHPPAGLDEGPGGLLGGDPLAADCVFQNFTTALVPGRNSAVRSNLFITCVTGIRGGGALVVERCVFYRCLNAAAAAKVTLSGCVLARCRNTVEGDGALERTGSADMDDPFVNPFRGDFRLRPDAGLDPGIAAGVGPAWSDERWEMFIANFDRPLNVEPLSLAAARDLEAMRALERFGEAVKAGDWQTAAGRLAEIYNRYDACPSVRRAAGELEQATATVLAELVRLGDPAGGVEQQNLRLAAERWKQASEALAAGRKDEALQLARQAAESEPTHLDAAQLIAELLLDAGRPSQAEPVLRHAGHLLEASAHTVAAESRSRQTQLLARLARMTQLADDWDKLQTDYADRFAGVAGPPGPPSTVLALRRAVLLAPRNRNYRNRLADAEKMVAPLNPISADNAEDADKAKALREQADKEYAARQFNQAVDSRRQAWMLDSMPEDLMFLANCYQRLNQSGQAAVMALQARQSLADLTDEPVRARRILQDAVGLLRSADPALPRVEQLDADFLRHAEVRVRMAESLGDKDTAERIAGVLAQLTDIDALLRTPAATAPGGAAVGGPTGP